MAVYLTVTFLGQRYTLTLDTVRTRKHGALARTIYCENTKTQAYNIWQDHISKFTFSYFHTLRNISSTIFLVHQFFY